VARHLKKPSVQIIMPLLKTLMTTPWMRTAHKHTHENSIHISDAGNVSGSDVSVGSDDDPGGEFDERELGDCCELKWINDEQKFCP